MPNVPLGFIFGIKLLNNIPIKPRITLQTNGTAFDKILSLPFVDKINNTQNNANIKT